MQGSHHPTEYYWEVGVKSGEKKKNWDKISPGHVLFRGLCPKIWDEWINKFCCQHKSHANAFVHLRYDFFFSKKFHIPGRRESLERYVVYAYEYSEMWMKFRVA